jgi:hypothetical protein
VAQKVKRRPKADDYKDDDYEDQYDDDDDEEYDDRPRGRSRRSRDDDDDDDADRPRGRSRRSRDDDDDDDEDDRPRRSKRDADDDDDDDDRPRRNKRRSRDEDEDDRPRRSKRRSRDDDDERPRGKKRESGGWNEFNRNASETSSFAHTIKLTKDPQLIKFLEDEPVHSWNQHWIEREGKKSFVCLGKRNECPLCDIGDKPRSQSALNAIVIDEKGNPSNGVIIAGIKLANILQDKAKSKPLTDGYWSMAIHGKGGQSNYEVARVKERDLEEDWDTDPLSSRDIKDAKEEMFEPNDIIQTSSRKELNDIAKNYVGDYDGDDDDDDDDDDDRQRGRRRRR